MAKILIIDDEADMRFAMRMLLERTGHQVVEAGDGEAALKKLAEENADLALLDMRLPGMDGIQILQRIKTEYPNVPVVMVTGYGNVELADQALQMGADHYLSKPFHNKELLNVLHGILQKRGLPIPEPEKPVETVALATTASPEPAAAKKMDRKQMGIIGGAVFAVGALAFFLFGKPAKMDYPILYSNPSSLIFRGQQLWVSDWFTQSVYVHDLTQKDLKVLKTYYMPDVHVTGMAMSKDALYTADSWTKSIRKHKLDDRLTVVQSVPSPGGAPCSLFFDGKYLWSCDLATGKIYQHQPDERFTVVAVYSSPGAAPVGFFKDDLFGWTLDAKTRQLYERRLDGQLTVKHAYQLREWEEGSAQLASFTWHGDDLWYARTGKPFLYRRHRRHLDEMKLPPIR